MTVKAMPLPPDSLLAGFGGPEDYRDCFSREVPREVSLEEYIERFYCSVAFRAERIVLGLIGRGASDQDARALARGEVDRIAVWEVVERRSATAAALRDSKTPRDEILLLSKDTGTASWLAVEPTQSGTRLLFGSWVGNVEQSGWRMMLRLHILYSRVLLAGAAKAL